MVRAQDKEGSLAAGWLERLPHEAHDGVHFDELPVHQLASRADEVANVVEAQVVEH